MREIMREAIEAERKYLSISPADEERLLTAADRLQAERDETRRQRRLSAFREAVGPRFAAATLVNYVISCSEQQMAMDAVQRYVSNFKERVADGSGIVAFGSAGSGKTHLMVGMGKEAIDAGFDIAWRNGPDLFAEFRSTIGNDASESEDDIIKELVDADILILDDILPPSGSLSEYQAGNLYRIVNQRYHQCRPTWATMNVVGGEDAERGMGCQIVDRLRHGALTLYCGWESHRKAQT